MKRRNNLCVLIIVFATGFSSVVTQLVAIREFLADFEGNEFVISLILLCWLVSSGIGSLMAGVVSKQTGKASAGILSLVSALLAVIPCLQILAVRYLKHTLFVQGSSVGFYPTLAFICGIIPPYALLVGFVLSYSLFVMRSSDEGYPASRIYLLDCLGAAAGGAMFSFILVHILTPLQIMLSVNMVLLGALCMLFLSAGMRVVTVLAVASLTVAVNLLGVGLERWSLRPASGELVLYRESSFGRIAMIRDKELYTAFVDGKPALSGENVIFAEEAAHYALSQTEPVRQILLVSAEAGIVDEVRKYRPDSIDYAEIDPALSRIGLAFGFMRKQPGLTLINDDARAFLKRTRKTYDAVLVNYPMPKTFQTNRYFTLDFMRLAKTRLRPGGVLGFSVEGYESYISEPARKRVSSLHNTALSVFTHVLVLPGQKIYFVASDAPLSRDITGLLAKRGIRTSYISGYYVYDISDERVGSLMKQMESKTPMNTDFRPFLMKLSYEEWFMKYSARPWLFIIAAGAFFIMSMLGMNRDEFALFSTGFVNMGGELLTIFLFQILYGFLYLKIGIIVTVFLAGLIPGAWLGGLIKGGTRKPIIVVDCLMSLLLFSLLILLVEVPQVLPEVFFYVFAFVLSVLCGIEFPLVAGSGGDGNMTAARAFSVDLVGAAFGGFILSVVLIPYEGILFACTALILIKLASIIMQVGHGTVHQENIPTL